MCGMLTNEKCSHGYVQMLRTVITSPEEFYSTEIEILASGFG